MNARAIVLSLIVLVLIAGTYYIVLNNEVDRSSIEIGGTGEKIFADLKFDDVEKITLVKGDTEVVLTRNENDEWIVSTYYDYHADKNNVERLFQSISTMILEREASTRVENFSVYEVTGDLGVQVKFVGAFDKELADILVGKASADDYNAAYVRMPDEDRVLVAKSEVPISFTLGVDYKTKQLNNANWVDKKVTQFSPDDLRKIEVVTPGGVIVLENIRTVEEIPATEGDTAVTTEEKWSWWVTEPENIKAEANEAAKLVRNLAALHASDAVAKKDLEQYGLDAPDTRVIFQVMKKQEQAVAGSLVPEQIETVELLIGDKTSDDKYYFKRAGDEEIFLMAQLTYQSVVPSLEKLKPVPAEPDIREESGPAPEAPAPMPMPTPAENIDTATIPPPRVIVPEQADQQ
jgi:uncharacterized protein DUF4340